MVELIELEGPTHKIMSPKVGKIGVNKKIKYPGSAKIFKTIPALLQKTMIQMVNYTGIFVPIA